MLTMNCQEIPDAGAAHDLHEACRAARGLKVVQVRPGLHEAAEDIACRPIYRVAPEKRRSRVRAALPWLFRSSMRCVKLPAERTAMPPEAARCCVEVEGIPEREETAVFLDTELMDHHLRAMLAVRIAGRWYSLHRWTASWKGLGLSRRDICRI